LEFAELFPDKRKWSATAAKNDLAGTVAFYSDDAVLLAPNAPIATDQKSIRESWAALLGPNTAVSWKVSKAEVAKSGELGYLYGTYELSIKDPKGGPPVHDTGKLVEIWKKRGRRKVEVYRRYLQLRPSRRRGSGTQEVKAGTIFQVSGRG
jgi:ketosteroid isomerase-like protein